MFCLLILASIALLFLVVTTIVAFREWFRSLIPSMRDHAASGASADAPPPHLAHSSIQHAPPRTSLDVGCSMLGVGCASPSLAALDPGEWIIAAAAAVTAIGAILAFIRREAHRLEPAPERRVTGGPIEVALLKRGVERHEHDDLKATVARQRVETWEVINGLRRSVSKIEADVAGLRAQREANGERLTELSGDIKGLSKLVHRLAGIVETKLEGTKD